MKGAFNWPYFLPEDKLQSTMEEAYPKQSLETLQSWEERMRLKMEKAAAHLRANFTLAEYQRGGNYIKKAEHLQRSLLVSFPEFWVIHAYNETPWGERKKDRSWIAPRIHTGKGSFYSSNHPQWKVLIKHPRLSEWKHKGSFHKSKGKLAKNKDSPYKSTIASLELIQLIHKQFKYLPDKSLTLLNEIQQILTLCNKTLTKPKI